MFSFYVGAKIQINLISCKDLGKFHNEKPECLVISFFILTFAS